MKKTAAYSPLLLVLGAAILWSTGGLFIKATHLSAIELSFGRSLLAAITIAIFTRREGFGLNRISALTSILYAALLLLFVLATKLTTAANAIFLQYTAPVYVLILEPLFVQYGVNVVYSGHDHIYERIKPQKGIYYFVSGSAGQLRKAVGVLKKRMSDFENNLRELEITRYGVKVGRPLTNLRGILTGTPQLADHGGDRASPES